MFPLTAVAALVPFFGFSQAVPYPPEVAVEAGPVDHVGYKVASWNGSIPASEARLPPHLLTRATGGVVTGGAAVTSINNQDGIGSGSDTYKLYKGDGSLEAGWPTKEQWVSFENMFNNNKQILSNSCVWNNWVRKHKIT